MAPIGYITSNGPSPLPLSRELSALSFVTTSSRRPSALSSVTSNVRSPILMFAISVILFLVLGADLKAQAGNISPDLQLVLKNAGPDQKIDVIVILSDQVDTKALTETKALASKDESVLRTTIITTLKTKADETQTNLKMFLISKEATKLRPFWIFNGLAVTVSADVVSELAGRPEIDKVRLDMTIPLSTPMPATTTIPEWNIDAIRAPELWNLGFSGQNIVVANMDTGVDVNHSDIAGRWRGGANSWYDPNGEHTSVPTDTHGHGTQTMGIMVGGDAGGTSIGVAPDAQWIAVKIFKDAIFPNPPVATIGAIHAGFEWLLDPDNDPATDDAPDIVNNSWDIRDQVNQCNDEFQLDIQNLKAAGIAVVFAAGNSGPGYFTSVSPANYPESFAVGAVDENFNLANFSSRGRSRCDNSTYPDVVAPGDENTTTFGIKTSDLTDGGAFPESYAYVTGTSFAAPHAAGAMALLLAAFPGAAVSELETALKNTALDLGFTGPDNDYGYGLIDTVEAYRSMVPCTDADSDGFYAEAVCGTAQDCDDSDDTIYPGAPEIKHDDIDQDCNGYDLTIDIVSAEYLEIADMLCVSVTSAWEDTADLMLDGYGAMNWAPVRQEWTITVDSVGGDPLTVTASGVEGAVSAPAVVIDTEPCEGDFVGDGDVDGWDFSVFQAAFGAYNGDSNYDPAADFDADGVIDEDDLAVFVEIFGQGDCPDCD